MIRIRRSGLPLPSEPVAIIAAVAQNGVIGRANALPWRLPSDLAHFKRLTLGQTLVIGRRTHESIGRTLPGRRTIVVTRAALPGVETAASLAEAIGRATTPVFLAGGASIYAEGMALAETLHITRVAAAPEGDTLFPDIPAAFVRVAVEPCPRTQKDDHEIVFETWRGAASIEQPHAASL